MTDKETKQKDYYYTLGVDHNASFEEIHEAYERLYEKFGPHVTLSGQDPDLMLKTFKEISEAYEVLINPERRKQFDETGHLHAQKSDLRKLWTNTTGTKPKGGVTAGESITAADTNMPVTVTLKEALRGTRKEVTIKDAEPCSDCASLKPLQRIKCPNCRGMGISRFERKEEIELPPGLYHEMEYRIHGNGGFDVRSQRRGDLVLTIEIAPHAFFKIVDRNLTCTVPVSIYEAVLGGDIEIPTATGKVVMKIQPLSQNGRVYRLRGLGLAGGDQLVTIEIRVPEVMNEEQKSLFQRLANMDKSPNPRQGIM